MADGETGFCFRYSVEKSEGKGLGVFAREAIGKGSIVWRHRRGIFVVYDERSFRAKIETMSPAEVVYELTHVHAFEEFPGCLIRALDDGVLVNHSRSPTLRTSKSAPSRPSVDVGSRQYLNKVTEALLDDRYSLVAARDIEIGEEFTNDYLADDASPPYYDDLYEHYGIREDFLDDR